MPKMTLNQKLLAIMEELPFIQKDKKNPSQGYSYASEEAIKRAIHPLLVKYGVLVRLDVLDASTEPTPSQKQLLTTARFGYTFTNAEDGEKIEGTFMGSGCDPSDKGLNKAITAALKYLLTSTFLIPTGDDPEASRDEEQPMERIPVTTEVAKPSQTWSATQPPVAEQLQESIDHLKQRPKGRPINANQSKRMYAIAMSAGWGRDQYKAFLDSEYGIIDDRATPAGKGPGQYDQICARLEQGPPESPDPAFEGDPDDMVPF